MTLVILFEEAAVMVGDLMASSYDREQFDEARIKVRKKDRTPFYSAYPLQKIIRIQDRFHIAWSGSLLDAEKIINYARDLPWPPMPFSGLFPFGGFGIGGFGINLPKTEFDATIGPLITEILKYRKEQVPKLQLIISMVGFQWDAKAHLLQTP